MFPYTCIRKKKLLPKLRLLNCGVGEDSWEFLGLQGDPTILKISPGCSLEGMMLKLKLQYFGHLMRRVDSLEKTLKLGGIGAGGEGDDRGWEGWIASLTRWTWVWVNSGRWWWTGRPGVLWFLGSQRVGHDWAAEPNWTESFLISLCKPLIFEVNVNNVNWIKCFNKITFQDNRSVGSSLQRAPNGTLESLRK